MLRRGRRDFLQSSRRSYLMYAARPNKLFLWPKCMTSQWQQCHSVVGFVSGHMRFFIVFVIILFPLTWSRFKTSTRFRTYCLNSAFDDSTCAAVQYCTSRSTVELLFANSIINSKFLCRPTIKCIQMRLMSRSYRTNISQLNSTQGCETFAIFDYRISQKIGP